MKREKREGFFAEERSRFSSICESWSLNSNRDIHQPLWSYGFLCFQVHCLNSPFIEAFACWNCTLKKIKSALFGSKVRVWILFIRLNLFFCGFFFFVNVFFVVSKDKKSCCLSEKFDLNFGLYESVPLWNVEFDLNIVFVSVIFIAGFIITFEE